MSPNKYLSNHQNISCTTNALKKLYFNIHEYHKASYRIKLYNLFVAVFYIPQTHRLELER